VSNNSYISDIKPALALFGQKEREAIQRHNAFYLVFNQHSHDDGAVSSFGCAIDKNLNVLPLLSDVYKRAADNDLELVYVNNLRPELYEVFPDYIAMHLKNNEVIMDDVSYNERSPHTP